MDIHIQLAGSADEIDRCFPVMHELRPHLDLDTFAARVQRQQADSGYRLAFLESEGVVQACAGFRIGEYLAWGRILYVDDLVTTSGHRSEGFGGKLFDWLVAQARAEGCVQLHLDSGVQRFAAHRFYLGKRMEITSHHFGLKL